MPHASTGLCYADWVHCLLELTCCNTGLCFTDCSVFLCLTSHVCYADCNDPELNHPWHPPPIPTPTPTLVLLINQLGVLDADATFWSTELCHADCSALSLTSHVVIHAVKIQCLTSSDDAKFCNALSFTMQTSVHTVLDLPCFMYESVDCLSHSLSGTPPHSAPNTHTIKEEYIPGQVYWEFLLSLSSSRYKYSAYLEFYF